MTTKNETCGKTVRKGDTWGGGYVPCGKPAKVECDGKHYCGIHDPAKQEAKRVRWDEESKARFARYKLEFVAPELADILLRVYRESGWQSGPSELEVAQVLKKAGVL